MPCRQFQADIGRQTLGIAGCVVLSASRALSFSTLRSRCPGAEADQTHREAYAGLHRRVRAHGLPASTVDHSTANQICRKLIARTAGRQRVERSRRLDP